jgi:hypothetical protein
MTTPVRGPQRYTETALNVLSRALSGRRAIDALR